MTIFDLDRQVESSKGCDQYYHLYQGGAQKNPVVARMSPPHRIEAFRIEHEHSKLPSMHSLYNFNSYTLDHSVPERLSS